MSGSTASPLQRASERKLADAERERLTSLIEQHERERKLAVHQRFLLRQELLPGREREYAERSRPYRERAKAEWHELDRLRKELATVLPYCNEKPPASPVSALSYAVRRLRDRRAWSTLEEVDVSRRELLEVLGRVLESGGGR